MKRLLILAVCVIASGCGKSPEQGMPAIIEKDRANKAEYEGRSEDAAKHRQRAAEETKKYQDYEAWKRANGK